MNQISKNFTNQQLTAIIEAREQGLEYSEIANLISTKFKVNCSSEAARRAYNKYGNLFAEGNEIATTKALKDIARTKKSNANTAKENRVILESLNAQDDLLIQIKAMIQDAPAAKLLKAPKPRKVAGKPGMTVEALISDVHVGKKTDTFNVEVCRARLTQFTATIVDEIGRKRMHYNVERLVLGFLGDNIENAIMHGRESAMACEFGNPEQVRCAIELFFYEILVPLAALNINTDVVCIQGNHDREEERPTFNNPGKNSLCWIIYHTLKMLCDRSGMKNLNWILPEGVFAAVDIYGDTILYEHGDRVKGGGTKAALMSHIASRSAQLGKVVKGLRIGHFHEFSCLDNGRVIVNGSVPGQDSYAEVNGYNSIPGQVISYYVDTKNRDNRYYHSFLVVLT